MAIRGVKFRGGRPIAARQAMERQKKPGGSVRPVLIVEDDEATAELEKRALGRVGLMVRIVARVDEGVALLRSKPFLGGARRRQLRLSESARRDGHGRGQ